MLIGEFALRRSVKQAGFNSNYDARYGQCG